MTAEKMREAQQLLVDALSEYRVAQSDAELRQALLTMHTAVQDAFVAYLAIQANMVVDERTVNFPKLVDLVRDHTDLFGDDEGLPGVLVSLNTRRTLVAHPKKGKRPSPEKIRKDTAKFDQLIRRFWPKWFGTTCPEPSRRAQPEHVRREQARPETPRPPPYVPREAPSPPVPPEPTRPSRVRKFLRQVWTDPAHPRLQWWRLIRRLAGIVLFVFLANACKEGALYTALWPKPVKYVGLGLMLAAGGLLLWSVVLLGKVLWQLRLKRLLILAALVWVLVVAVSFLTAETARPFHQQLWLVTQGTFAWICRAASAVPAVVAESVSEFQLYYNGRLPRRVLGGPVAPDPSRLTPIPANRPAIAKPVTPTPKTGEPATALQGTPTADQAADPPPTPAVPATLTPAATLATEQPDVATYPPPDCPHALARLTVPGVNQVVQDEIQVEGSANIENLGYYKFEFRREDVEDEWHWVESFEEPVQDGSLGTWHVGHLSEGTYRFRLTVVNKQGNYPFPPCEVSVVVRP